MGKSRLAAELARRAKGVTALSGRCLSYGEGITYWPLREVVEQAAESEERAAVLAALDADTPPPAPEIAWRFRQFCEAVASERPLVLVLDDVHWAEPTFLELVEHLADKGNAPLLVVCLAREELLEDRPSFLEGRENAERIVLDALSAEDTDALLEGLGGAVLESDQRRRIVETAEGNPLFLEQLLALALEGGLAERPLPETIQSLLAARLDRLGPGERAVLERGAVVGKDFSGGRCHFTLLEPDAAPTAAAHLRTLSDRGFVRPRGGDAFGFRHVLVQEAVYRAAPKRLRAELHERFADRLDQTAADLAELDEFVGYHLERAYRLRTELGESDRRTQRLADDGGRRLGAAGMPRVQRATSLRPSTSSDAPRRFWHPGDPLRRELLCELAIGHLASGDPRGALDGSWPRRSPSSQPRATTAGELRARLELESSRLVASRRRSARTCSSVAERAIPIFEAADDRPCPRARVAARRVRARRPECLHGERLRLRRARAGRIPRAGCRRRPAWARSPRALPRPHCR